MNGVILRLLFFYFQSIYTILKLSNIQKNSIKQQNEAIIRKTKEKRIDNNIEKKR